MTLKVACLGLGRWILTEDDNGVWAGETPAACKLYARRQYKLPDETPIRWHWHPGPGGLTVGGWWETYITGGRTA